MAEQPTIPSADRDKLIAALKSNYVIERRNAETYAYLATLEREPQRQTVLQRLADAESQHAERWAAKLKELGLSEESFPRPWTSAVSAGFSTTAL